MTRSYVRPGAFMRFVVNPLVRTLGLTATLKIPGRHSGVPRTTPFGGPIDCDGGRYLVSGRGETDWARNLRAAGRGELRVHGRSESFRAQEVVGAERERVLAAYRAKYGTSVRRYFEAIPDAAGHPVFRISPA